MSLRFLLVLTLLVGLHSYVGLRLIEPSHLSTLVGIVLWTGLVLMPVLQISSIILRVRKVKVPTAYSWCAFMSLGTFWLLVAFTFLRDLIWWTFQIVGALPIDAGQRHHLFNNTSALVAILSALALLIGWVEARRIPRIRRVNVSFADLPRAFDGFTIAQISDLHIGDAIRKKFVNSVVRRTNDARPDIVTLTGDIVDCPLDVGRSTAELLGGFHAPAYYVTGNHEYYSGVETWLPALREIGLEILHNEHRVIQRDSAELVIAGVPDHAGKDFGREHTPDFDLAAEGAPDDAIKIVLSHQPRTAPQAARAGFHLQLSGHTHGGQIWPWNFLVLLQQPVVQGWALIEGMKLWTSRGTGYWGPPLRFAAPSEITILRLQAVD